MDAPSVSVRFLFTWFQTQVDEFLESGLPFEQRISWGKSSFLYVNWFLYVLWRSVYLSTYQDSVVHFSLFQLKPRGVEFEYFVKTLLAHSERSALLKKCLLFHPVVPYMKNCRLIVDSAETRRPLFCFLKATQLNISRAHLASCRLSKCGDISEAELVLGKGRVFVARQRSSLRACLSAQFLFPGVIRNILACNFVLAARSADS